MKRRLVLMSPEARTDLRWIYDTISAAASSLTAMRYLDRIGSFCERLEYGAERGTRRGDLLPGLRVIGFERRVTVAFVVETDRVLILRVFYGGADWEAELAEDGEN
jgi:plasmid stabilization system protein ParE